MPKFIRVNDRTVLYIRADLVTSIGQWSDDGGRTVIHLKGGQIVYVDGNVFDVVKKIEAAMTDESNGRDHGDPRP